MENEANSPSSISLQNSEWLAENIKGKIYIVYLPSFFELCGDHIKNFETL